MQRRNRMRLTDLIADELYLIPPPDPLCPSASSLRGIFDKTIDRSSRSASDSSDLQEFRLWHPLPEEFVFCRRATRSEFRDYVFNLAYYRCGQDQLGEILMPVSVPVGCLIQSE